MAFNPLNYWKTRSPALKYILSFVACILLFYAFYWSSFYEEHVSDWIVDLQAKAGVLGINLFGEHAQAINQSITSDHFSMSVAKGCDGVEVTAMLAAGILSFTAPWKDKLKGALIGVLLIGILNILRFPVLYFLGKHGHHKLFDLMHVQGGFIIFISASILYWLYWAKKTLGENPPTQEATS